MVKRTNFYRGGIRSLSVNKNMVASAIKKNSAAAFLLFLLLLGLAFGAIFMRNTDTTLAQKLDFLFFSNYEERMSMPAGSVFVASFASSFLFVFACFLCGLSVWGGLLVPFLLLFRGFGLGITAGYLIAQQGIQGFLFYFIIILPGAFLCFWGLILAAKESLGFSKRIIAGDALPVKQYFVRFGLILGVQFGASLLDGLTSACFARFFSF